MTMASKEADEKLESDKFGDQASLRNERQNNIHSEDQCPNNHFFQEGTENQGNNPPPASDNECPEYEQSTRNYGQCPGFKYQKLDDTIAKPDEHIVTAPARPVSAIVVQTERFSNLIALSILSICFCPLTGIAAFVHAFKARSAEKRGEILQAHYHARFVWSMMKVSLVIGISMFIFNFVIRMFSSRK